MDENEKYFNHLTEEGSFVQNVPREKQNKGTGMFLAGLAVGTGGALLIAAIAFLGVTLWNVLSNRSVSSLAALSENTVVDQQLISKLQLLTNTINDYYYLEMAEDEDLQEGIYRGLMDALGDPYTVYYSAEELIALMQDMEGTYYGIGAYMQLDEESELPLITGVIAGSPAEEAGLRANDLVYSVDGVEMRGMALTEAVSLIKGPEGTEVTLVLIRENEDDYLEITLARAQVETPTVSLDMMEDNMAYIQVTEFDSVTVDQFADALATAKGSGMKGMILDLRGNPGGSLDAVVDMCEMILPQGLIVYTENKNGRRQEYKCDGSHELQVPLVVLVDRNSASASEIMAGAIKDYGIGTLVGTTTFGKGIVQQLVSFKDGSAVKITSSAYYTPAGNNIHGTGIEPDVVCEFDGEAYYGSEEHPDNQLEKAKEVLLELMGQ